MTGQLLADLQAGGCRREAAGTGLAQRCIHMTPDRTHGINDFIRRYAGTYAGQSHICRGDRIDGTDDISFYAGDLYEAGYRIAGKTEQVLQRQRGSVADFFRGAAEKRDKAAAMAEADPISA